MTVPDKTELAGRDIFRWIVAAAEELAVEHSLKVERIAVEADCSWRTVERFRKREGVPRELGNIIRAYARLAGLPDERAIYARALQLWLEDDSAKAAKAAIKDLDAAIDKLASPSNRRLAG